MGIKYTLKDLEKDYGPLTFSDLLIIQREDENLSQTEMAGKLSISKQKLCDLEKGRRIPSARTAVKWAKKLKLPPELCLQVALQDQLKRNKLKFKISVAL